MRLLRFLLCRYGLAPRFAGKRVSGIGMAEKGIQTGEERRVVGPGAEIEVSQNLIDGGVELVCAGSQAKLRKGYDRPCADGFVAKNATIADQGRHPLCRWSAAQIRGNEPPTLAIGPNRKSHNRLTYGKNPADFGLGGRIPANRRLCP